MVAITDASYIFQSILVKGNIVAYVSFFYKFCPMKRVCPFKGNIKYYVIYLAMLDMASRAGVIHGHGQDR